MDVETLAWTYQNNKDNLKQKEDNNAEHRNRFPLPGRQQLQEADYAKKGSDGGIGLCQQKWE